MTAAGPFDSIIEGLERWATMEREHARFKAVLEDIAVGRWNTGARHLDTDPNKTANEYAAAALNHEVHVYQEGKS